MDPFRDELAAAHAKIAHLEEQVQQLKHAARDKGPPPAIQPQSNHAVLMIAIVLGVMMALGGVGALFFLAGSTPASSDPSFRSVATATPPQAEAVPPVIEPGAVATASASAKSKLSKPCNCAPGDPLCSCL